MTITATVIADSAKRTGGRITTMQLRYPRFIHSEFMTHRVFSRNASSSRAIPIERLIQDVIDDTAYPARWGKNQPGMQAREDHDAYVVVDPLGPLKEDYHSEELTAKEAWFQARDNAVALAQAFARAGYHKQVVNRLLEPFAHINVVVTSTEWSNFFALRDHPDADPTIHALAQRMKATYLASMPKVLHDEEWHLPYVTDDDRKQLTNFGADDPTPLIKTSVARCARVSYLTHDGRKTAMEEDIALYERLVGSVPLHASPAEHQATPRNVGEWGTSDLQGNFKGWLQYRKFLEKGLT